MNSLKNILADVVEIENRGRFHPHVSLINFPVLFLGFDFVEDEINKKFRKHFDQSLHIQSIFSKYFKL